MTTASTPHRLRSLLAIVLVSAAAIPARAAVLRVGTWKGKAGDYTTIQDAVDAPRIHHQWLPDELVYEPYGLSGDTQRALVSRGHKLVRVYDDPNFVVLARQGVPRTLASSSGTCTT